MDLENAEILQQRKKAEENLFMFWQRSWAAGMGNGRGWSVQPLILLFQFCMSVTLFTGKTGCGYWIPRFVFCHSCCILFGGWCSSRAAVKGKIMRLKNGVRKTSRSTEPLTSLASDLCMKPEYAKDVRIYGQNHAADRAFEKMQLHDRGTKPSDSPNVAVLRAWGGFLASLSNAVCYLFVVAKAAMGAFGVSSIVRVCGRAHTSG